MACRLYRAKMQQTSPEVFKVEEYKTCWNVESMVSVGTTWKCRGLTHQFPVVTIILGCPKYETSLTIS
jgi:hypothetical protein